MGSKLTMHSWGKNKVNKVWPKNIDKNHKLWSLLCTLAISRANFTNILLFHQQVNAELTVVHQGVECRSWAYFQVVCNGEVGRSFVGETERRLLAPKNDYRRNCPLRYKVGEMNPKSTYFSPSSTLCCILFFANPWRHPRDLKGWKKCMCCYWRWQLAKKWPCTK